MGIGWHLFLKGSDYCNFGLQRKGEPCRFVRVKLKCLHDVLGTVLWRTVSLINVVFLCYVGHPVCCMRHAESYLLILRFIKITCVQAFLMSKLNVANSSEKLRAALLSSFVDFISCWNCWVFSILVRENVCIIICLVLWRRCISSDDQRYCLKSLKQASIFDWTDQSLSM